MRATASARRVFQWDLSNNEHLLVISAIRALKELYGEHLNYSVSKLGTTLRVEYYSLTMATWFELRLNQITGHWTIKELSTSGSKKKPAGKAG